MIDELREEEIVNKVGGRFKLSTLIQKRLVALNAGGRPLVDIDSEPVVRDGLVYVVTYQGRVAAVDLDSGRMQWRRDMSSHSGIAVDERYVYVTDAEGSVWGLDRRNSASLWRQSRLKARGVTSPVAYGNYVVVGDFEGYLHWLRRDDGQFVARVRIDSDGLLAPPIVQRGTLYAYGRGGTLAALQAP